MDEGQLRSINILGSYTISGVLKSLLIRCIMQPEEELTDAQQGLLIRKGFSAGFIRLLEGKERHEQEQLPRVKIPYVETGIEIKHTICDICAPGNHCRVNACVKDGKLMKVEGDPEHPFNHGILCTKGSANSQYVYRKERLFAPMKWTGPGAAISSSPLHGRRPTGPSRRILIASRRSRDRRAWLSIPATGSGTGSL